MSEERHKGMKTKQTLADPGQEQGQDNLLPKAFHAAPPQEDSDGKNFTCGQEGKSDTVSKHTAPPFSGPVLGFDMQRANRECIHK